MLLKYILSHTSLPESSVKNTIKLLNEDCTIPFISRYRKEATGNLDEVQIGDIVNNNYIQNNRKFRNNSIINQKQTFLLI